MVQNILLAILIVTGVVAVPLIYLGLRARAIIDPADRQLVMEGRFRMVVHGDIISTRGRRPIAYPVTCVYFDDGRSCTVFGTILVRHPPGTRVAVWRDRSSDRHAVEKYEAE